MEICGHGFVGRREELVALDDSLALAEAGEPVILLVEGVPGIGKTTLLRHFVGRRSEVRSWWLSGDETESALAFGMIDQLRTVSGAGSRAPTAPCEVFAEGAELLDAVETWSAGGTGIIVIDDLHWADLASSRAILYWLRRLRAVPVLVALTCTPASVDRLGESWQRLLRDGARVRTVGVGPVGADEARALAAAAGRKLAPAAATRLVAHTRGNPLYLAEAPASALAGETRLPAPRSYALEMGVRRRWLSAPAGQLLAAAAVLGPGASTAVTAAIARVADAGVAHSELVEAHLLARAGPAGLGDIEFAHPLDQAAVYGELSQARRRELHLRAAKALDPVDGLAHRVAAAEGADDALATELRSAAAAALGLGEPLAAAGHLIQAWRLSSALEPGAAALLGGVELLLAGGDLESARARAADVDGCQGGARRRFVQAALAASAGELGPAAAALREIIAATPREVDPDLFGRVAAALARVCTILGQHAESIGWARAALDAAGRRPAVEHTVRLSLALALAKTGRADEALAALSAASPSATGPSVTGPSGTGPSRTTTSAFDVEVLTVRADALTWSGAGWAALAAARDAVGCARAGIAPTRLADCYVTLADAEDRAGLWDEAIEHVEIATGLIAGSVDRSAGARAHAIASGLHARRGRWDEAARHLRGAVDAAARTPFPEAYAYRYLAATRLSWARRDWPGVLAAAAPMRRAQIDPGPGGTAPADDAHLMAWRLCAAEALLRTGALAEAARVLDEASAGECGSGGGPARARLVAALRVAVGDLDGAAEIFAAAAGGSPDGVVQEPFDQALLLLDRGRFLAELGRPEESIDSIHHARDVLWRLGARPFLALADGVAARAGLGCWPESHRQAAFAKLTARELAVVRQVVLGLTNREVAAHLFVSVKTIGYHLGHVFEKLGVHSRRQLRALLVDGKSQSLG